MFLIKFCSRILASTCVSVCICVCEFIWQTCLEANGLATFEKKKRSTTYGNAFPWQLCVTDSSHQVACSPYTQTQYKAVMLVARWAESLRLIRIRSLLQHEQWWSFWLRSSSGGEIYRISALSWKLKIQTEQTRLSHTVNSACSDLCALTNQSRLCFLGGWP